MHLKIHNGGRIRTTLSNKSYGLRFTTVNVPFLCSNILKAPTSGVYISKLIQYFRACISDHDFFDRGSLLTLKLLKKWSLKTNPSKMLRIPSQVGWQWWSIYFIKKRRIWCNFCIHNPFLFLSNIIYRIKLINGVLRTRVTCP